MVTLEEVIRTFIQYNGSLQGLWTDYGLVFNHYLTHFKKELENCSLFKSKDSPNKLSIRCEYIREVKLWEYTIYRTDENAAAIKPLFVYRDETAAGDKFLEMYYEDNPTYIATHNNENESVD